MKKFVNQKVCFDLTVEQNYTILKAGYACFLFYLQISWSG